MRKLIALLTIFSFNAHAVAPTGVGGEEGSLSYTNNLKAPAYTITSLGGVNSRIETGNTNILMNPSFEHTTVTTGWTVSNATPTAETTNVVEGKKSLKLVLTAALTAYQDSTINASQLSGLQGVAAIKVKNTGAAGLKACVRNAGVTSSTLCVNIPADSTWKHISIPFIMTATSNGIALTSTGTSGTVYVDDAFVGTSAPFQDVSGARLVGTVTVTGCTSNWATSSTTYADLGTQTGCTYATTGSASAPSTNIPAIKFTSLPAGDYRLEYEGMIGSIGGTTTNSFFQFSDGTNTAKEVSSFTTTTVNGYTSGISQQLSYSTSQSNITLSIKAKTSTVGGIAAIWGTNTFPGTIKVWYFPPATKIYSQASQDYDWTAYTPSYSNGFGTLSNVDCVHKREGSDLLMKCKFTSGTATASEARIGLPTGLTSANTPIIGSLQVVGIGHTAQSTTSAYVNNVPILMEPNVTYVTFQAPSTAVLSKGTGSAVSNSNAVTSFFARFPIQGWSDYGVIVGSFAGLEKCANDYECTDTFSAQISSAGVKSNENIPWLSSCVKNGTGDYSCTYNTNLKDGISALSSSMNCVVTQQGNPANYGNTYVVTNTTTGFNYRTVITNTVTDVAVAVKCQKGSQDYKPKTAKVASSIGVPTVQNPGTKAFDVISFSYAGANAGNPASWTNCNASPCNVNQMGTGSITSVTRSSAGSYTINFGKTYSNIKCTGNATTTGVGYQVVSQMACLSCSSMNFATGSAADTTGTINCFGEY